MKIKIIITTTNSKIVANNIANKLVERNIATCVQIIDSISSTYKWKNKVVKEKELLIFIKASIANLNRCKKVIKEIHNYDVPEIISLDSNIMSKKYADWFFSAI